MIEKIGCSVRLGTDQLMSRAFALRAKCVNIKAARKSFYGCDIQLKRKKSAFNDSSAEQNSP
jgi:hypothetical protein